MARISRMFEVIQLLRAASAPLSAERLAEALEVSKRTIYRDIAALQAMRVPIEGAAGIGYMMRRGYDLPALNFDRDEIEALRVGLSMLSRTGDSGLQRAAKRVAQKIDALHEADPRILVAPWGAPVDDPALGCISKEDIRSAIRDARKLRIRYRSTSEAASETERVIRPIAIVYHLEAVLIAAWCELRGGFRHFRADRIWACDSLEATFQDEAPTLLKLWEDQEGFEKSYRQAAPS